MVKLYPKLVLKVTKTIAGFEMQDATGKMIGRNISVIYSPNG